MIRGQQMVNVVVFHICFPVRKFPQVEVNEKTVTLTIVKFTYQTECIYPLFPSLVSRPPFFFIMK